MKTHGKSGEVIALPVRGLPFLVEPGLVVALTPPALDRERFTTVEGVEESANGYRIALAGIEDLNASEGVVGCYLLAREDDLELGLLDVAWDDLIDRAVIDGCYGRLGVIKEVIETPANDVWSIEGPYGTVLLPVIEQVVQAIPEEGPIPVVALDGLIDAKPGDVPRPAGEA
ncbi:ribosome maturation factor RimM [Enorma phocaeensis]|uniref:ribosome maturation factor RimM n=1 Tax=Enorma phocaeensis TaxID=1871019 RepID=UPI002352A3F4|nr:16S rRNA processing protein RimM [Enorma phocaeensis]